jgi:hypothetical protein
MARLPWLGEYATPEAIAAALRPLFLDTVSRLVPAALEALRDDVLPVYERTHDKPQVDPGPLAYSLIRCEDDRTAEQALFTDEEAAVLFHLGYELFGDPETTGPGRFYVWQPKEGQAPPEGLPQDSCKDFDELSLYLAQVQTALRAWGKPFCLTDQWILAIARGQLDVWHRRWYLAYPHCKWPRRVKAASGSDKRPGSPPPPAANSPESEMVGPVRLEWHLFPGATWFLPTSADERRLSYEHEGWDPTAAPREATRRHILAHFERFLDEYLDRMESYVLMEQKKWRRSPDYVALEKHMEWLVRYQCQGESFPDIDRSASDYQYATGETVEKPVRRLAKLMDLKLRPGTRGRPPRSKNKPKRKSLP